MGEGSIECLVELEREIARLQALQVREIADYSATRGETADVASELALGLSISENAARIRIGLARDLVSRLPGTLAALSRGDIDAYKASKVSEPTAVLSDSLARAVDAVVADRLAGRDPSSAGTACRAAAHRSCDGHPDC